MDDITKKIFDELKDVNKQLNDGFKSLSSEITKLKTDRLECRIECNNSLSKVKLNVLKIIIIALASGSTGGAISRLF